MSKFAKINRSDRKIVELADQSFNTQDDDQFAYVQVEDDAKVGDIRPGSTEGENNATDYSEIKGAKSDEQKKAEANQGAVTAGTPRVQPGQTQPTTGAQTASSPPGQPSGVQGAAGKA